MKTLKKTMHTIVVDVMALIVAAIVMYASWYLVMEALDTLYYYTDIINWLYNAEILDSTGDVWAALLAGMGTGVWVYNHLRNFILNGGKDIVEEETEEIKEIEGA